MDGVHLASGSEAVHSTWMHGRSTRGRMSDPPGTFDTVIFHHWVICDDSVA